MPFKCGSGLTLAMCNVLLQVSKVQVKTPPSFDALNVARQRDHSCMLLLTCCPSRSRGLQHSDQIALSFPESWVRYVCSAVGRAPRSPAGHCSIAIGDRDRQMQILVCPALTSQQLSFPTAGPADPWKLPALTRCRGNSRHRWPCQLPRCRRPHSPMGIPSFRITRKGSSSLMGPLQVMHRGLNFI